MNFAVVNVSRGDIRLTSDWRLVRVLGEALMPTASTDPSYVIFLNSLHHWQVPLDIALTEAEKRDVVKAIQKHFHDRGSVIEFR